MDNIAVIEPLQIGDGSYGAEKFVIKRLSDKKYKAKSALASLPERERVAVWKIQNGWTTDKYSAEWFDSEEEAVQKAQNLGYEVEGYEKDDLNEVFPNWMEDDSMAEALSRRNSTIHL